MAMFGEGMPWHLILPCFCLGLLLALLVNRHRENQS